MWLVNYFGKIGIDFIINVKDVLVFTLRSLFACINITAYPKNILKQMINIGFYSLPVVAFTALFAGMVLALQSYSGFSRFSAESAIASVVAISITRELGPVFTGLMVAGRIGASMAAELGTMKVTNQIDALRTLSTDPFKYLVVPRVIAAIIVLPFLVIIADIVGIFGGFLVSVKNLDFNPIVYMQNTIEFLEPIDVYSGLVKAAAFGFIVSVMGCYQGYRSNGGAEGVGIATTKAVVLSSIWILVFNYIITALFFS